jgi:hypothetical protein
MPMKKRYTLTVRHTASQDRSEQGWARVHCVLHVEDAFLGSYMTSHLGGTSFDNALDGAFDPSMIRLSYDHQRRENDWPFTMGFKTRHIRPTSLAIVEAEVQRAVNVAIANLEEHWRGLLNGRHVNHYVKKAKIVPKIVKTIRL